MDGVGVRTNRLARLWGAGKVEFGKNRYNGTIFAKYAPGKSKLATLKQWTFPKQRKNGSVKLF